MKAWQVPPGGISSHSREEFWALVDRGTEPGHWLWAGRNNSLGTTFVIGRSVIQANRLAWALQNPSELIPDKLFRQPSCIHKTCVNPGCFRGKRIALVAYVEPGQPQSGDEVEVRSVDSEFHVPRIIEAMGAIQFGLPVRPRTIRRLQVEGAPEIETIQTLSGPLEVKKPVGALPYIPRRDDIQRAPKMTAQQILDLIFQPNTMVVTFPSGRVWISTPDARVDADDGQTALLGILTRTGQHKVKG